MRLCELVVVLARRRRVGLHDGQVGQRFAPRDRAKRGRRRGRVSGQRGRRRGRDVGEDDSQLNSGRLQRLLEYVLRSATPTDRPHTATM